MKRGSWLKGGPERSNDRTHGASGALLNAAGAPRLGRQGARESQGAEMSEQIERRVLEVWSGEARILEGVFELSERADADQYVCNLACEGTLAKVLQLDLKGCVTRRAAVLQAWAETPFPPKWFVVVNESEPNVVLAVYGANLRAEAEKQRLLIARQSGCAVGLRSHVHPVRPVVGQAFRERG